MSNRDDAQNPDEKRWIAGLAASDLTIFREIYEYYGPYLRKFASISVSEDISEDMVQDIFVSLWERRLDLKLEPGNLDNYLFGAVRNKTLQHKRNLAIRSKALSGKNDSGENVALSEFSFNTADSDLLLVEFNDVLAKAIGTLTDAQRKILMLRWGRKLSYEKIGEILEVTPNTAMQQVSRIRQIIKPVIQRYLKGML